MKNAYKIISLLALLTCTAFAQFTSQSAKRIISGTPKPSTCGVGDKWVDTGTTPATEYMCRTANTWVVGSGISNSAQVQITPAASISLPFSSDPQVLFTDMFITLTQSTTITAVTGPFVAGSEMVLTFHQNAPGGFTVAFPANFLNVPTIQSGSGVDTAMTYQYCGAAGSGTSCPAGDWQNTDVSPAIPATMVQTNQTNVYTTGLQDFSAVTMEVPEAAGFATNVDSTIGLDTTNNRFKFWINGADTIGAGFVTSSPPAGGKCVHTNGVTGLLTETAADCLTSAALSSITAASATPTTIANGNNVVTWNWAQTTDSQNAFTYGETSAGTNGTLTNALANQAVLKATTASASTSAPFSVLQGSITGTVAFPAAQFQTTWNNAGLTGTGLVVDAVDTSSAAGSLLINLLKSHVTQFNVTKAGAVTAIGGVTANSFTASAAGGGTFTINSSGGGSITDAVASTAGTFTNTKQAATDTYVYLATADTLTNKTLTTPKITTINDANGNPFLLSSATASAVDSVMVTNAATANPATVTMAGSGTDTNINTAINAKGAGIVKSSTYFQSASQRVTMVADWTCGTGGTVASCTAATIVGSGGGTALTLTLPLQALSWHYQCDLVASQATGLTANNWNLITSSNGATNVTISYMQGDTATTFGGGSTTDQASTTTTFNIGGAWTLGSTGTKIPVHIAGTIESVSASGTVISFQLVAPTVGDLVSIYRGATCWVDPL